MKITEYHGMLSAFGGGWAILGGVAGWSLANKIPRMVIQQNCKLISYGLIGVGLIGISSYWLMKVDHDVLKKELEKTKEDFNEVFDKSIDNGKDKNMTETQIQKSESPIRDGKYHATGHWYIFLIVEEAKTSVKDFRRDYHDTTLEIGNFGEADPDVVETTGEKFYNVKLTIYDVLGMDVVEQGVVSEDGARITVKGSSGISELEWITEEEAEALEEALEAEGNPVEAPPCPYKIQPENLGKFVWIAGPPGVGKSTSARLLSRDEGYVYYEGDCFFACRNPYIPPDVTEPSLAAKLQRNLVGEGLEERRKAIKKYEGLLQQISVGDREDYDNEVIEEYFGMMCEDIKKEREKIGGDWEIASVIYTRELRDFIRACLGPDLVIVVLNIGDDHFIDRLLERHHGDEAPLKLLKAIKRKCDPAGEDEENTLNIMITNDMTEEEVVKKISLAGSWSLIQSCMRSSPQMLI